MISQQIDKSKKPAPEEPGLIDNIFNIFNNEEEVVEDVGFVPLPELPPFPEDLPQYFVY